LINIVKKFIYFILLAQLIYYGFLIYQKGYKFDANDPDASYNLMLKLTDPMERMEFVQTFEKACQDARCTNLHGLTKKEIYETIHK